MGLDMFLTGKRWVPQADAAKVATNLSSIYPELEGMTVSELQVELLYWRKANAIHNWFVKTCQNGVDECQYTPVDLETLTKLLEACKAVRDDHSKAMELLPPVSGFFFGSTDLDEGYFQDLDYTITGIEKILAQPEFTSGLNWSIGYQSSW